MSLDRYRQLEAVLDGADGNLDPIKKGVAEDAAEEHLRAVAASSANHPSSTLARQSISEALHYRGRIAHARGRHQTALELYVQARDWASTELEWEGYHHLRVAEILFAHGSPDECRYHLDLAEAIFKLGLQRTSGESQLAALRAHEMVRDGEPKRAVALLKAGIRSAHSHGFQRGEILFPVELAKIRLAQRRYDAAAALIAMAGSIYLASTLHARPSDTATRRVDKFTLDAGECLKLVQDL